MITTRPVRSVHESETFCRCFPDVVRSDADDDDAAAAAADDDDNEHDVGTPRSRLLNNRWPHSVSFVFISYTLCFCLFVFHLPPSSACSSTSTSRSVQRFRSFPVRWSSISPLRLHPFSSYPRRLYYISDFPRARLYNNTPFSDFPTVQRCSPTTMKPTRSGWTAADCEVHRFVMAVMSRTTCVNGSQLYKWIYVCWIKRKFTYIYIYNTFCFPPS